MPNVPIIVAGGGIGGLSAGIALAKAGIAVRVIEQADEFRAIGYGIQLGPNAFHAFQKMGIDNKVLKFCSLPDEGLLKDAETGGTLLRLPMALEMSNRYGQPYAVIHRADLHQVLGGGFVVHEPRQEPEYAHIVASEQNLHGVLVALSDQVDQHLVGSLLVG